MSRPPVASSKPQTKPKGEMAPPHPAAPSPFWPYPAPGLPPAHRVWAWLEAMDGGPWEDASLIPEGVGTTFKTKIAGYQRVSVKEWDEEGNDPATFGLYPPPKPKPATAFTFAAAASAPKRPESRLPHHKNNSPGDNKQPSPEASPEAVPEESPEVGRGHKASAAAMDFDKFSGPPSPIWGNFIPVSSAVSSPSPSLSPSHSSSPQREPESPSIFNIAKSEEDRLQELVTLGKMQNQRAQEARDARHRGDFMPASRAYEQHEQHETFDSRSRSRSRSPVKYGKAGTAPSRSRSSSPIKVSTRHGPGVGQPRVSFTFEDSFDMSPVANSALAPKKQVTIGLYPSSPSPSIAHRRRVPDLSPIDVALARQEARAEALHTGGLPNAVHIPYKDVPQTQQANRRKFKPTFVGDDSSSTYSQEAAHTAGRLSVDPLQVSRRPPNNRVDLSRQSIFDSYTEWKKGVNNRVSGAPSSSSSDNINDESTFASDYHAHKKSIDLTTRAKALQVPTPKQAGFQGEPYSSLNVMFPEIPKTSTARQASKTMIGNKGWLEDTSFTPRPQLNRKPTFFDSLRKKAKSLVHMRSEVLKAALLGDKSKNDPPVERQLVISLDPREQSLVYCELEFIIASALNGYITCQFNAGRVSMEKLKKISDGWQQKGRPKVVGFRYDIETQLDLVRMHVGEFRFYSRETTNAAIYGIIDMMRVNARAIRIRTYCQPDTVISKQILDTQNLMNILGCSGDEHGSLASITRFYKDAVAREKVFHSDRNDTVPDSARARYADQYQSRDDSLATPSKPGGVSRSSDRSRQQARENTYVAATPGNKNPNPYRARSPVTPWPM